MSEYTKWMICYGPDAIRDNYRFMSEEKNAPRITIYGVPNGLTPCFVLARTSLHAVRNPHVADHREHFREMNLEEAIELSKKYENNAAVAIMRFGRS